MSLEKSPSTAQGSLDLVACLHIHHGDAVPMDVHIRQAPCIICRRDPFSHGVLVWPLEARTSLVGPGKGLDQGNGMTPLLSQSEHTRGGVLRVQRRFSSLSGVKRVAGCMIWLVHGPFEHQIHVQLGRHHPTVIPFHSVGWGIQPKRHALPPCRFCLLFRVC